MKKFVLIFMIILALAGCSVSRPESPGETLTLMTWNVHNLFDGKDDGYEYAEYRQSSGWSEEKYLGRLNSICAAIGRIEPLPDIIVFQEIESLKILEDLASLLPKGYYWGHFANNPESAIGLGIISRFPILEAFAHSININKTAIPRPVLEVRVQDIVVFICHWKSKIGGADKTEFLREAAAQIILRRCGEIWETEPELGIIIAGDLNMRIDELESIFAIDTLWFSPWINELENGSYFYRGNWETIDHFLVSRQFFNDDIGWAYRNSAVINFEPFAAPDGTPVPYNPRTGYGLSDHFPLLMILTAKR